MQQFFSKATIFCSLCLSIAGTTEAQTPLEPTPMTTVDTSTFKPSGNLWGYTFGDYAYKGNSDVAYNPATPTTPFYRGGSNQYTGMPASTSMFQFRRIYLGYSYDISPKFTADFLLAAEDDFNNGLDSQKTAASTAAGATTGSAGDVLSNSKFSPYVKIANIRWKNIFKNSDLTVGQQATPSFAKTYRNDQTAEEVWGYRSIERTISDIRRTPSFDMGVSLQGWFDKKGNFGYMLMVGNGQSAKPENDNFKWFYGDVYAKFFEKDGKSRLLVDIYQDYERLNWGVWTPGAKAGVQSPNGFWYHDRNMTKLFLAWNTKPLTIGFEGFQNTILGDIKVTGVDGNTYYRTSMTMAMSFYVRGRIVSKVAGDLKSDPMLNFFARFDNYDPSGNLSNIANDVNTKAYAAQTSNYEPTTKEQFVTLGLDYMPFRNVHIMPNLWLNTYTSALSSTGENSAKTPVLYDKMNSNVSGTKGTDAVWRLTFYYIYNPKKGTTIY